MFYNYVTNYFLYTKLFFKGGIMNKTILIIEDELKIRFLLRDYLKTENFNVLEASDGDEGLVVFKNNKVDLILLDIMMPKIDGITVLETIRTVS